MLIRSMPMASTSSGILPKAWAASVCIQAPAARARRPISAKGWRTPISLLAAITETSAVRASSVSSSAAGSTSPSASTGRRTTSTPSRSRRATLSSTQLCSVATVITRSRPSASRRCRTAPLMARLLDSVAPDVKTMSRPFAPMTAATASRAASTASAASQPSACSAECGLPGFSVNQGSIASTTRGSAGVVAW